MCVILVQKDDFKVAAIFAWCRQASLQPSRKFANVRFTLFVWRQPTAENWCGLANYFKQVFLPQEFRKLENKITVLNEDGCMCFGCLAICVLSVQTCGKLSNIHNLNPQKQKFSSRVRLIAWKWLLSVWQNTVLKRNTHKNLVHFPKSDEGYLTMKLKGATEGKWVEKHLNAKVLFSQMIQIF